MLSEILTRCNSCGGKGTIKGFGGMDKECNNCKCERKLLSIINIIYKWISRNILVTIPLIIFSITLFIYSFHTSEKILSVLAAFFGLILAALKHKLDKISYQKNLFEERYAIFIKIQEVLSNYHQGKDYRSLNDELDSIYRKSYFLFGNTTYQFVADFKKAICNSSVDGLEGEKARNFLIKLIDGQNLSKKFPELKIDAC